MKNEGIYLPFTIFLISFSLFNASRGVRLLTSKFRISSRILSLIHILEGDHKGTTLYINGEKAERLEGRVKQFYNYTHKRKDKMYMQETLVFPMRQIGDVQNGFRGKLRNINCMQ